MIKLFFKYNKLISLILLFSSFSLSKEKYQTFDLKLPKGEVNLFLPLYYETNDTCSKWVPSLFSSIILINTDIELSLERYKKNYLEIGIQNPFSNIISDNKIIANIYTGPFSIFNDIYLAKTETQWPQICQFGLDYTDIFSDEVPDNLNTMKKLISSEQIEKYIFSFGKNDLNSSKEFISSKFFIGDSHENFLEDNVGICEIKNDTGYFGCIFDDYIFMDETYSLINEKNNKSYIIYFSSELNYIYFPESFKNKFGKCKYETFPENKFTCEESKGKDYINLKLRNNKMNITLEIDNIQRFYTYPYDNVFNILFHKFDYIIFPLTMLKNFHTQFNLENNTISFYTNDTTLLEIRKKEEPPTDKPTPTDSDNGDDGPSTGLIVFLVILGILIIGGLGYGGFLLYKKKYKPDLEKNFNKYSKFDDEEINENKIVY